MICFAISRSLPLSLFFIAVAGLGQMMHTACTNTLLQLHVDDDKRGRVMSFYTVCLQGTMPFGSLLAGAIAGITGGPWAVAIMGSMCLLATIFLKEGKANRAGNANLASRLRQLARHEERIIEGTGFDPRGTWPEERSFLVLGLDLEASRALGREFKQNAIVWSGSDAIPRLILLR